MSANTLLTSVVTGGTNSHATVAEEANSYATDFVSAGVVGSIGLNSGSGGTGSFCVNADASPDMGVTIKAGQAYVTATPSGQNSQVLRVRAAADYTAYTINANASGSTKYDWIYLSISATNANTPSADASNVASFVTSRSSNNSTDDGTPPTYGILLAVVTVANGASSITNSNISDRRTQASLSTSGTSVATGWITGVTTPSTITCNGNRSYTLVFNSTDLTGTLSPGMRLRLTRLTAAPTQCTSLNGTTQYYSKTSPAGMTFTDDFVVSAWLKVSSYGAANQTIASRWNGTSGWEWRMNSTGQLILTGYNAGGANFSYVLSYQSVPLNKWVHVAAQLDMSTFTATTTTSYVMIDGVDVPATVSRGGTNPTALVQAGNLEIGSGNGGLLPFNGKIAQVAIYSAKVTQATIRGYIAQGLSGTETSLISAYSFNNSINDLNSNANNLTANGSAVATNADSPFSVNSFGTATGTTDYAIVTSSTFSTNTTVVVQVPEANTIPTSGGVSAVAYSLQRMPYGFPGDTGKWTVGFFARIGQSQSSPVQNTWYNLGSFQLNLPIGSWKLYYATTLYKNHTTSADIVQASLSTSSSSETNPELSQATYMNAPSEFETYVGKTTYITNQSTATPWYLIARTTAASVTTIQIGDTNSPVAITAECAYL